MQLSFLTPVSPAAGHRESLIEGQTLELPLHEIHALPRSPVETVLDSGFNFHQAFLFFHVTQF